MEEGKNVNIEIEHRFIRFVEQIGESKAINRSLFNIIDTEAQVDVLDSGNNVVVSHFDNNDFHSFESLVRWMDGDTITFCVEGVLTTIPRRVIEQLVVDNEVLIDCEGHEANEN